MKSVRPPSAAIVFMTYFYRAGGEAMAPLAFLDPLLNINKSLKQRTYLSVNVVFVHFVSEYRAYDTEKGIEYHVTGTVATRQHIRNFLGYLSFSAYADLHRRAKLLPCSVYLSHVLICYNHLIKFSVN